MCAAGALINIEGPSLDELTDGNATKKRYLDAIVNLMSLSVIHNELNRSLHGNKLINKVIV